MKLAEIVFSPTGGTKKVAQMISKHLDADIVHIDLSDADKDFSECDIGEPDMALIAMPSFGGRAPAIAIERLKQISGKNSKCVLVCVYGNRAYEDTLVEMEDAAKESEFQVIAAVAAVAEHSIMPQYATRRPDTTDEKQLKDFASKIKYKTGLAETIPGKRPYKRAGNVGLVPKPKKYCVKCGVCATNCPVHAIDKETLIASSQKCISCMRCVKQCPKYARSVNNTMVSIAALAIKKTCSTRKQNELYL